MMVQKFRTKTVEIEAIRFVDNLEELQEWTGGKFRMVKVGSAPDHEFVAQVYDFLHTTWINVSYGQWIVRGAKNEFYPCDDETFHWKYEEVKEPDFTMTGTLEYRDGEVVAEGFEIVPGENVDTTEPVRFEG